MLDSDGRVHQDRMRQYVVEPERGKMSAWEEGGCVTTRGNRAMPFDGFPEALPVICAPSLLIDSIGKELENLSFQEEFPRTP